VNIRPWKTIKKYHPRGGNGRKRGGKSRKRSKPKSTTKNQGTIHTVDSHSMKSKKVERGHLEEPGRGEGGTGTSEL